MSQSFILKASDDALALTGFYQEIQTMHHQWYPEVFKPFDNEAMHRMIRQQISSSTHFFYIAYSKETPCGFMHLEDAHRAENSMMFERHWLECAALAVLPDAQESGVGIFLLRAIDDIAKEKGYAHVTLNFWAANQVQSFYEHNGYQLLRHGAIKHL
ncbi:GNAT family N-acetyltransferase [Enterococcus sp.]|uniref:GNAT family N-acetyltransferase n=1 Tax=Enterococcus sp. TaxID=35783 RepID=UPI0028A8D008|nr:GNAT family N-acetyltransferase [Enterococcus sp.]